MAEGVEIPGISKTESTLLGLFIPSVDRESKPIDQETWEQDALELLGRWFGGATAFPKGRGVWRDDQQGGKLIFDETIVIHCYTNLDAIDKHSADLRQFLVTKGQETNQGAVGYVIDRTYLELRFPLSSEEATNG
jgi:hypothetical protein